MTSVSQIPAFDAFETQLKTLCVKEFPCGLGSWREKKVIDKKIPKVQRKELMKKDLPEHKFTITHRDYGPQYEKTETLEELVTAKQSIWNLDYSWSNEAKELREIAVRSPWLIDDKFVFNHFITLRITDKQVTEVDENLLNFVNLEELTLSANYLKTINSQHLPPKLTVLECCANEIWSLQELCLRPPPLLHLGLGYNQLSMVDDYITGQYWPHLLSLDLSRNNLSDMMDLVKKLATLPKLRNLILQGNPLTFIAGYRGYTCDSLRELDILDDIAISADERHHYKGLAKRREYILDEAKLHFRVDYIHGVPMPEELRNPDDQPEFPVISRKYYVQFMFLEDKSTPAADMLHMLQQQHQQDGLSAGTTPSNMPPPGMPAQYGMSEDRSTNAASPTHHQDINSVTSASQEKNVNFAQTLETLPSATPGMQTGSGPGQAATGAGQPVKEEAAEESIVDAEELRTQTQQSRESAAMKLMPIKSAAVDWSEDMEINWKETICRDDLLAVRDFFRAGMDIAVMEEKIESFPAPEEEETASVGSKSAGKGGKGGKGKEADKKKAGKGGRDKTPDKGGKKDSKSPDKKGGKVASGKDDKGKKKKKGEPEIELMHMPPTYTTLAKFHIPLDEFLNGEFVFENVFMKASTNEGFTTPVSDAAGGKKDKKDKDKKGKPTSGKKDKDKKDRGKSPKVADKKGDKGKDKKASNVAVDGEEEPPPPPPPLECHVHITLHHWKTAMDSLKDEKLAQERSEEP